MGMVASFISIYSPKNRVALGIITFIIVYVCWKVKDIVVTFGKEFLCTIISCAFSVEYKKVGSLVAEP